MSNNSSSMSARPQQYGNRPFDAAYDATSDVSDGSEDEVINDRGYADVNRNPVSASSHSRRPSNPNVVRVSARSVDQDRNVSADNKHADDDDDDDDDSNGGYRVGSSSSSIAAGGGRGGSGSRVTGSMNVDDDEEEVDDDDDDVEHHLGGRGNGDEDDNDDDDDDGSGGMMGGRGGGAGGGDGPRLYNPAEYAHLPVPADIAELFGHITRFKAPSMDLVTRLQPFIPDMIPSIGEVDDFVKVPRPDGKVPYPFVQHAFPFAFVLAFAFCSLFLVGCHDNLSRVLSDMRMCMPLTLSYFFLPSHISPPPPPPPVSPCLRCRRTAWAWSSSMSRRRSRLTPRCWACSCGARRAKRC